MQVVSGIIQDPMAKESTCYLRRKKLDTTY
jgi:hypothetical protein